MNNTFVRTLLLIMACAAFLLMALASSSSDSDSIKPIAENIGNEISSAIDNLASENSAADTEEIMIEEQVLVDRDGILITAKSYTHDSIWGDGIKLLVENNSDQTVTVSCRDLVVNHYMISNLFVCEVAAGKKVNKTLDLLSSSLQKAGIETVAEVGISFHVYNSDSWDGIFDTELITLQTSAYGNVDFLPNDSGKELYSDGQIRIVGRYVDEDTFWGTGILLYLENNTSSKINVSVRDLSVNSFMLTPYFSCSICPGCMAMDEITLMSSEMEENEITTVEEVELSFHITDDSYFNTLVDTPPLTFNVGQP